jgi:hypothetical protein
LNHNANLYLKNSHTSPGSLCHDQPVAVSKSII